MARWLILALAIYGVAAQNEFAFDDNDYVQYKTLPQLPNYRITKWDITYHDRSQVAPGYWFTAPYWIYGGDKETNQWRPYQIGPHIFDEDGTLVWAGSAEFDNAPVYDFRAVDLPDADGSMKPHLSWMRWHLPEEMDTDGVSTIYDQHYQPTKSWSLPANDVDTHDLTIKYSRNALEIHIRHEELDLGDFGRPDIRQDILTCGFTDTDLVTGEVLFDWRSTNKVKLNESYRSLPEDEHPNPDYMHANAIDKNDAGDYLLSGRHTGTIYLIDGKDGHIIWHLGGKENDFEKDFDFFGQHDSRFISVNSTHMVISLFNNGAFDEHYHQKPSSAMYIQLDVVNMTATLLNQYFRPDGEVTDRRGNMQTLPNGNVLAGWSWDGYVSEYSHDGELLMEAKFASDRHDTYRSYKFPWTGRPMYPPTLLSEAYGVNGSELSTVFHVSWNGATDIAFWRFYARHSNSAPKREIGLVSKEGFETSFIARGYMDWVSVEALDSEMNTIGESQDSRTSAPGYWAPKAPLPEPNNPETAVTTTRPLQVTHEIGGSIVSFLTGLVVSGAFCAVVVYRRAIYCFVLTSVAKVIPGDYTRLWSGDSDDLEGNHEFKTLNSTDSDID
ncbi:hypothetical protein N7478_006022 [Penicillium angulare]|uniref:uncharacterized protein n=1 Tax=Penicillium angulare TaxID=116970 RepID=UPI002541986D|nr:uncharacterized protein N7478_006022 [Penicillium angulare]KAJ5280650.1 hypothetical protein N7478_006022 [Penicillium angulare]